jgi:hypothetical protein
MKATKAKRTQWFTKRVSSVDPPPKNSTPKIPLFTVYTPTYQYSPPSQQRDVFSHSMARFFRFFPLLIVLLITQWSYAQVLGLEEGSPDALIFERLLIKTNRISHQDPAIKPYSRESLTAWAMALDTAPVPLSASDRLDLFRIYKNNNEWLVQPGTWEGFTKVRQPIHFTDWEGNDTTSTSHVDASSQHARYVMSRKPIWNTFFRTPANLYETHSKGFYIKANALLRFTLSRDIDDGYLFANQRGIRLRGGIDERIYFATEILETQARLPGYVQDYTDYHRALPGNGLYKTYTSTFIDVPNAYDYLNAQGYIGFRIIPHVHAQLGHGRHFIGNGYRSLLLSDFSNNYFYLKLQSQFGPFTYQNIFAELAAFSANGVSGDRLVPKKYLAAHYLSVRLLPNLRLGLFESVVYNRSQQMEWQYLNPVILYRSVEHLTGSPDNVLIGLNADWSFLRRFQLYGQVMMDEFKFKELFVENRGWWANKYGYQIGLKAIDVAGVDHLDLQVEFNSVRPYTYQHFDSLSNYIHYNMPLAHPLGANFSEWVFKGRYQPSYRWVIDMRYIRAQSGRDVNGQNFGSDLLRTYNNRVSDYGNTIGQGLKTNISLLGLDVTYELFHQFYLQVNWFARLDDPLTVNGKSNYIGTGIRWNLPEPRMDF